MRSKQDLRPEQQHAIDFGLSGADMLLLAAIGYGKTAIIWTIIQEMVDKNKIDRFLVLAPMRVARMVWPYEREQWAHTQHLRVAVAAGESAKKRRQALESDAHVVTMNYENVKWLFDQFGRRTKDTLKHPLFRDQRWGIVFDEVDKMKSAGTARFKAMRQLLPHFRSRLGMTGTPTPNHLHEIWGQAYCVAEKECGLGTSYTKFKEKYFYSVDYHGYEVKPHVYAEEEIYGAIAPYTYRIGDDASDRTRIVNDIFVEMAKDQRKAYVDMETELIAMLDDLEDPVVARSAAAKSQKLIQMATGFVYYEGGPNPYAVDEYESPTPPPVAPVIMRQVKTLADAKLSAIEDIVSELQGEQLLVVYNYIESRSALQKRFPRMRFLDDDETIDAWNKGEFEMLGIHPQSAGHGLNLHLGGCKNMVYLTLPWSGGLYEQTNGRIDRRGQGDVVYIHRVLAKDTIDERIVEVLAGKQQGNNALLAAMKRWTEKRRA